MVYEGINAELCEYDKMSADELEQSLKQFFSPRISLMMQR